MVWHVRKRRSSHAWALSWAACLCQPRVNSGCSSPLPFDMFLPSRGPHTTGHVGKPQLAGQTGWLRQRPSRGELQSLEQAGGDPKCSGLDDRQRVTPRNPACGMAVFLRRPEAETTETHSERGRTQRVGQTSGHGFVVLTGIIGRRAWRQNPEPVIGAGRRIVPQKQPGQRWGCARGKTICCDEHIARIMARYDQWLSW